MSKRSKKRDVPVTAGRTIDALRARWVDLDLAFDANEVGSGMEPDHPLLNPVVVPRHAAAIARHKNGAANDTVNGYTARGLYRLVRTALSRVKLDLLEAGISRFDLAMCPLSLEKPR